MSTRSSPFVDGVTSDGIWTGGGSSWMYRALPVHPVFWQDMAEADSLAHIFDTLAANLHEALLADSAGRELHLLAVARDDPDETTVPQGFCGACGRASGSDTAGSIATAGRPRAAVFAVGVRLGAYGPPPEQEALSRGFYSALARRRNPVGGGPVGRFYERLARAFNTFHHMARHPYVDPGADATETALGRTGARPLDREQVDRLLGWQARAADLQDCIFLESANGESVEADAWCEDIPAADCRHALAGGLQFGVVPVDANAEASLGGGVLADAFAQRPGLVAVSVRAWLRRAGSIWCWSDISALAALRTAEGHTPDLESALPEAQVTLYRQMRALDEMCPLSPHRGVYLPASARLSALGGLRD